MRRVYKNNISLCLSDCNTIKTYKSGVPLGSFHLSAEIVQIQLMSLQVIPKKKTHTYVQYEHIV